MRFLYTFAYEKQEKAAVLSKTAAFAEILKFRPTRPDRAEAPSPGHRPGLSWTRTWRPVRAKALKYRAIYKAFALTGRLADCYYTQGRCPGLGASGPSART